MSAIARNPDTAIGISTASGRWVLTATVLGSGMAFLDSTVVNVALPTIGRHLHASLTGLQWVVTGYTLTLAGLILLGGALGDKLGRRKVFVIGVAWFALASALCGLSPAIGVLIAARMLQGVGGALLTPGSLAIIQATFRPEDRAKAIGAWSGLGGVAGAVGPLLGGWIVVAVGWRWVFLLNLPLAVVVIAVTLRHVPETRDPTAKGGFDIAGALTAALSLAGLTYALIEASSGGTGRMAEAVAAAVVAVGAGVAFVRIERHRERAPGRVPPMLPLGIFSSREFTAVNVVTFLVYGAFGGMIFLLVLQLQVVAGFSALEAGVALLPTTVLMLLLSQRSGALAQRIGPRWQMTFGPATCAVGVLLLLRIGAHASYVADVLPGVAVFGLGLSVTVAPLTATVLATADVRHAGVASGVNNAVARAAGLLAVAGLPAAVGLTAAKYHVPSQFSHGFDVAMVVCAVLLALGSVLSAVTIRSNVLQPATGRPAPAPEPHFNCPVGAPPLESARQS
jgi:EmrB/QacA subfamily drug resistance transporter